MIRYNDQEATPRELDLLFVILNSWVGETVHMDFNAACGDKAEITLRINNGGTFKVNVDIHMSGYYDTMNDFTGLMLEDIHVRSLKQLERKMWFWRITQWIGYRFRLATDSIMVRCGYQRSRVNQK